MWIVLSTAQDRSKGSIARLSRPIGLGEIEDMIDHRLAATSERFPRIRFGSISRYLLLSAFVSCVCAAVSFTAFAAAPNASPVGDAKPGADFQVIPAKIHLSGPDSTQQLIVEISSKDLTHEAKYSTENSAIAIVDSKGGVVAKGDGRTVVHIVVGERRTSVPVIVSDVSVRKQIHFANRVVPVFTKLGCDAGGCHGKLSGQNGFRLSLLGFDPALDYETLVLEGRGRRLFPAAPEKSLLLLKATAKVPHGGGKRMEVGSHEYNLVLRWIEAGSPIGQASDPVLSDIEIYPRSRVLRRGTKQQLQVTARYSDGSTEDVTRWAQYQSNDPEVASVGDSGVVETRDLSGQAAIMARYQGRVVVFGAKVPFGETLAESDGFQEKNFIDTISHKQWRSLGVAPSERCSDAEFIRRVSLDVIGGLPTAAETKAFEADSDPNKRDKLVDRLLERPEYAAYFAVKWADILRNKREGNSQYQNGTFRFYDWIRLSLLANVPYDRFAREILAASGAPETTPPVMWYRRLRTTDAFVDDAAQVFLGMRLQCAKCHHHPFEKWGQDDYYGFASFFARIGRKTTSVAQGGNRIEEAIFTTRSGAATHPRTGQAMPPKGLGGAVVSVPPGVDPRQKLVDWLADPQNPYFSRAVVNRYWAHFFGRGITEPLDDMRLTNPPSNPELLDALAADFVKNGYDLKRLVKTICVSETYGLSSVPVASNAKDKQSFSRHYPKRMSAEVLLDAISFLTDVPTVFPGMPVGTKAVELPDESVQSAFLDTFGRPKRDTPCECERVTDASLSQSLTLLNSAEVQAKLSAPGSRAEKLAADPRPDSEKIAELFWTAFGRAPSVAELAAATRRIAKHPDKKREAYEDVLWALVNSKEFQFID